MNDRRSCKIFYYGEEGSHVVEVVSLVDPATESHVSVNVRTETIQVEGDLDPIEALIGFAKRLAEVCEKETSSAAIMQDVERRSTLV